jgi:hypothetical protein
MTEQLPRPNYIWHGTAPRNINKILKEGILPSLGYVYACFSLDDCFKFFALPRTRFDYEKKLIIFDPVIDFIKIDTAKLDWSKAQYSLDHNPTFYGCEAIEYDGSIPADAIVLVKRFNIDEGFKRIMWTSDKTNFEITRPMPEDWAKV